MSKTEMKGEESRKSWIYGVNPVAEAIRAGREVKTIYVHRQRGRELQEIVDEAAAGGIPVVAEGREFFDSRFPKGHQGVAAAVLRKRILRIEELLRIPGDREEVPFFFILDGIEDPRNFGALLRVADAAGVHGVVHQHRRSAGITPVVSKASAGALEYVNIAEVVNIKHALEALRDADIVIVGAEAEAEKSLWDVDLRVPVAVVIGSEGYGLRRTVKGMCDTLVRLPMMGRVNSLNVSVAAGVLAYEVLRQRMGGGFRSSERGEPRVDILDLTGL